MTDQLPLRATRNPNIGLVMLKRVAVGVVLRTSGVRGEHHGTYVVCQVVVTSEVVAAAGRLGRGRKRGEVGGRGRGVVGVVGREQKTF